MKYLISLVFLAAHAFGEAPAPYPASGWRPQGPAFELPSENNSRLKQALPQTVPPSTSYGIPEIQFGTPEAQQNVAPQTIYGAPAKQIAPQRQYGAPAKQIAPQTQYGAPQRLPPTQLGPPQVPQSQQQIPQNQYGAPNPQPSNTLPQNQYGAPNPQPSNTLPQTLYGAPNTQSSNLLPQKQYGTPNPQPSNTLPQTLYGAPNPQSSNLLPQKQYGAPNPQPSNLLPQNQYGAPNPQPSNTLPQNLYGAPFQPTEIKLTAQQQQQLLNQLIKLQQFLSSQKRQQITPQNQYGAPTSSVDVRSGSANNPRNLYEPPSTVEPLNGDQNTPDTSFTPNTQYLPSFTSSAFRPEPQPSFRNQNNDRRLSFADEQNSFGSQNQEQTDDGYKTIVLTKQEEDNYNNRYGAPLSTTNPPPLGRRRPQSIPEAPQEETNGEENFDDASVDPNISVATAFASGRYYLLLPDGRLQKVTYKTTQSEEEQKSNGFTANLMYQLVDPIKDPIYTVDGTPYVPVGQN